MPGPPLVPLAGRLRVGVRHRSRYAVDAGCGVAARLEDEVLAVANAQYAAVLLHLELAVERWGSAQPDRHRLVGARRQQCRRVPADPAAVA